MWNKLNHNSGAISSVTSLIGMIIALIGLGLVYEQLKQANTLKKWENYNAMNQRYHEWYSNTPKVADSFKCESFEKVEEKTKRWIRSYFHLYSEEFWLHQNNLIPEEMWTKRIDGGVTVNLKKYPILVSGFKYWKNKGSFSHPKEFRALVDKKLIEANEHDTCLSKKKQKSKPEKKNTSSENIQDAESNKKVH